MEGRGSSSTVLMVHGDNDESLIWSCDSGKGKKRTHLRDGSEIKSVESIHSLNKLLFSAHYVSVSTA